jgi:chromosome segregation ATPase
VLKKDIEALRLEKTSVSGELSEVTLRVRDIESKIEPLNRLLAEKKEEIGLCSDKILAANDELQRVIQETSVKQESISGLESKTAALEGQIRELDSQHATKSTALANLESVYSNAESKLRSKVDVLEKKERELTVTIDNKSHEIDVAMQAIAVRQKSQEEQDQNLRIREAKVTNSESAIVRNSNLLNL